MGEFGGARKIREDTGFLYLLQTFSQLLIDCASNLRHVGRCQQALVKILTRGTSLRPWHINILVFGHVNILVLSLLSNSLPIKGEAPTSLRSMRRALELA